MTERPFDEYVDTFLNTGGPYGAAITFQRMAAKPQAPGTAPQRDDVGTIRMSWEHYKVMAFLMRRVVLEVEQQAGVNFPVPTNVLNDLRIAPEDWDKFWRGD